MLQIFSVITGVNTCSSRRKKRFYQCFYSKSNSDRFRFSIDRGDKKNFAKNSILTKKPQETLKLCGDRQF